jgi:hypothetical protein
MITRSGGGRRLRLPPPPPYWPRCNAGRMATGQVGPPGGKVSRAQPAGGGGGTGRPARGGTGPLARGDGSAGARDHCSAGARGDITNTIVVARKPEQPIVDSSRSAPLARAHWHWQAQAPTPGWRGRRAQGCGGGGPGLQVRRGPAGPDSGHACDWPGRAGPGQFSGSAQLSHSRRRRRRGARRRRRLGAQDVRVPEGGPAPAAAPSVGYPGGGGGDGVRSGRAAPSSRWRVRSGRRRATRRVPRPPGGRRFPRSS